MKRVKNMQSYPWQLPDVTLMPSGTEGDTRDVRESIEVDAAIATGGVTEVPATEKKEAK